MVSVTKASPERGSGLGSGAKVRADSSSSPAAVRRRAGSKSNEGAAMGSRPLPGAAGVELGALQPFELRGRACRCRPCSASSPTRSNAAASPAAGGSNVVASRPSSVPGVRRRRLELQGRRLERARRAGCRAADAASSSVGRPAGLSRAGARRGRAARARTRPTPAAASSAPVGWRRHRAPRRQRPRGSAGSTRVGSPPRTRGCSAGDRRRRGLDAGARCSIGSALPHRRRAGAGEPWLLPSPATQGPDLLVAGIGLEHAHVPLRAAASGSPRRAAMSPRWRSAIRFSGSSPSAVSNTALRLVELPRLEQRLADRRCGRSCGPAAAGGACGRSRWPRRDRRPCGTRSRAARNSAAGSRRTSSGAPRSGRNWPCRSRNWARRRVGRGGKLIKLTSAPSGRSQSEVATSLDFRPLRRR